MSTISYQYYPPRRNPIGSQILLALLSGLALFILFVFGWTIGYQLIYAGRIFPGVNVAGVDLSGLSPTDAAVKLNQTLSYPIAGKIVFRDAAGTWVASPAELGMVFDPSASALAAYRLGRSGGLFGALANQVRARGGGAEIAPVVVFDQRVAYQYLAQIAAQVNKPVVEASLHLEGTNVVAQPGQTGRELKLEATLVYLSAQLQTFRDGEVPLAVQEIQPQILDVSAQAETARQILSQPLQVVVPNATENDPGPWVYDVQVVANMLGVQRVQNGDKAEVQVMLSLTALRDIMASIKNQVDRQPANARFYFDDNTRQLVLVQPAKIGRTMDVEASVKAVNEAVSHAEHVIPVVVSEIQPSVTDSATAEQLGITQLVSEQTTYFYGSSEARVQNIKAASERFYGVFVAPGETFSMGQLLGDVSLENGFAEALIIYGGRTIKGVGGGVCQVSTTLFRTVFWGGYPIVERYSHAYRVSYYEETASGAVDSNLAGMDATVYFPLVDLKFTNDTPYWILMETYLNGYSLTWKFYSTSDGRSVTMDTTGPQNILPAPEPKFEENPGLNKNQMKQVDYAANGADVTVTRTVWRNGAVLLQDEIRTKYQPWQAVCEYGPGTEDPEKQAKRKELCRSPAS